jgi:hypothetical protein
MSASRQPLLFVFDRAPRFRRQLVEEIRQDGGEAYGVESLPQALRLLELFPRRFRVLLDLGPQAAQVARRLRAHPQVSLVEVLSPASVGPSPAAGAPRRRQRARAGQRGPSEPEGRCSSDGTVVHGARAKQAAMTRYPRAHGQAGWSQSTVSLDVQR